MWTTGRRRVFGSKSLTFIFFFFCYQKNYCGHNYTRYFFSGSLYMHWSLFVFPKKRKIWTKCFAFWKNNDNDVLFKKNQSMDIRMSNRSSSLSFPSTGHQHIEHLTTVFFQIRNHCTHQVSSSSSIGSVYCIHQYFIYKSFSFCFVFFWKIYSFICLSWLSYSVQWWLQQQQRRRLHLNVNQISQ